MSDIKRALDNKQSRPTRALGEPKFPIVDRRRSEKRRFVSSAASNARRSACIVAQLTIMSPIDRADEIEFKRAPPALQFMLSALMSSPGPTRELPPIAATWREHRIDRRSLTTYLALSGSDPAKSPPTLSADRRLSTEHGSAHTPTVSSADLEGAAATQSHCPTR